VPTISIAASDAALVSAVTRKAARVVSVSKPWRRSLFRKTPSSGSAKNAAAARPSRTVISP